MEQRDIGQEILDGIREIKRYKAGAIELRHWELSNITDSIRLVLPVIEVARKTADADDSFGQIFGT
jgi:hypothetical protein